MTAARTTKAAIPAKQFRDITEWVKMGFSVVIEDAKITVSPSGQPISDPFDYIDMKAR